MNKILLTLIHCGSFECGISFSARLCADWNVVNLSFKLTGDHSVDNSNFILS